MTFATFIAGHRQLIDGASRDVLRPDFDVLNAIEFGRRCSYAESREDLLRAARRDGGGLPLPSAVEEGLARLWAIYEQQNARPRPASIRRKVEI